MGVPDEHPELFEGLTRVQHMVEKGVMHQVPDAFIQPPHMRSAARSLDLDLQIPVIDMALLNRDFEGRKQVQADITRACEQYGFFQVINHGVPETLMDAAMAMAKKFFALSAEEKEVYKHQAASGAVGYGRIFEEYRKPDEVKEWLDRLTLDLASARDPSQSWLVVNNPPGFQEMYDEYGKAVYELHKKLLGIISEELGLAPWFLYSKLGDDKAFMRTMFNYYPPCPQPELVMGSAPHADACALTILQQEVPGLQLLHDGVWVPVPTSFDHAFVVNIGDSLQIISNGRFKSVLHRAVVHNTSRISIPNFLAPGIDVLMQPAAEMCDPDLNPPIYKGVTLSDFLKFVIAEGYGRSESRAVDHFRL